MKKKFDFKEAIEKIVGGIIGVIIMFGLIIWGINREKKHNEDYPWFGTVYSEINNASSIFDSDQFKTIEECRNWAQERASDRSLQEGTWDYNCGTNCEYSDQSIVGGKKINTYNCTELQK